jgi:hypothetical protein
MIERTTVRLPEDLLRRAKRKAATEGRTLTALIEEGLRLVLNETRAKGAIARNDPPVSTATGGLRPGVDITSFSKLQELDDLEYLKRLERGA